MPTSARTKELAESLGIPLLTLDDVQQIDVTIDGADEIDPQLHSSKAAGARCCGKRLSPLHPGR